jgi:hypothetical protein
MLHVVDPISQNLKPPVSEATLSEVIDRISTAFKLYDAYLATTGDLRRSVLIQAREQIEHAINGIILITVPPNLKHMFDELFQRLKQKLQLVNIEYNKL